VIPAILAAPLVQGVVGGIVNGVMNAFAPAQPMPADAANGSAFNQDLNRASAATSSITSSPIASENGTMRSDEWSTMSGTDVQSWAKSLAGKHADATDASGRTISGVVGGMQMLGSTLALNIGGHLVSLSQLKQISWSPSIA
jgi:hypothetical protein